MSTATDLAAEADYDRLANRQRVAAELARFADLYTTIDITNGPSIELYEFSDQPVRATWSFRTNELDEFRTLMRALPKNGPATKRESDGGTLTLRFGLRDYGAAVTIYLFGVCEMVDTGEVEEYEDTEVVEERTVTKTRPKYERRCPDALLALADAEVPA